VKNTTVLVALLVLAVLLVAGAAGSPAWSQSPVSPVSPLRVYLPIVARGGGTPPRPTIPAPTPTPAPANYQGVGIHRQDYVSNAEWACPATAQVAVWSYDWGPQPECPGGIPMIWDETQMGVDPVDSEWLLGFNEPDLAGQANITPTLAAELWHEIEAMYPDRKLVSPAVLSIGWLDDMWSEYDRLYGTAPRFDAVAFHIYPQRMCYQGCTVNYYLVVARDIYAKQAIDWAADHGIPEVWITEFALQPIAAGEAGTIAFMEQFTAWMREEPAITRWAWFSLGSYWPPGYDTALVGPDGTLTTFGEVYADQ
jgi:hypothetical protein